MGTPRGFPVPTAAEGDAQGFLQIVENVLAALSERHDAPLVRLVHVDNWFGPKWLGFAAKVVGAVGVWMDAEHLTVPPFVPNRILAERLWVREWDGGYSQRDRVDGLHRDQPSTDNLGRLLSRIAPGETVVWFSGNTVANGRGSLLVDVPTEDGYEAIHAQWTATPDWVLAQVKGTSRKEFLALQEAGSRTH